MTVQKEKSKLRQELKSRLSLVTSADQDSLRAHLKNWLQNQTGIWAAFAALPGEPDLKPLVRELTHLTWAFPRVQGDHLIFHQVRVLDDLKAGRFGVLEPDVHHPQIEPQEIQGFLVPGLGFDREGRRLGKGKGFYDRALAGATGLKLGVGFECSWVSEVPSEPHDQKLDGVVTERGVWMKAPGKR